MAKTVTQRKTVVGGVRAQPSAARTWSSVGSKVGKTGWRQRGAWIRSLVLKGQLA